MLAAEPPTSTPPGADDEGRDDTLAAQARRYLRNRSVDEIGADIAEEMRAHPMATVVIGLAAGFMLGKMLRR